MKTKLLDESLCNALLQAQAPLLPPPERARALRDRVLGRLHASRPGNPLQHLTVHEGEGIWVPLMPGIDMKLLREDASTRSYLLRMAPGTRVSPHAHSLDEECMVLEGDVWLGEVHAHAGDYHLAHSGVPHGVVSSDGGCLLFLRGQKQYPDMRAG
ncbi:MAG: cupin domain-containing protein [Pseudomonadota bacterium]|nr:cupin domain-containing protein [Pseudomonadota bacterium]